jgi:SAM-dependent methyltransferase
MSWQPDDPADPRRRFGPVAARYQRGRPSYPSELIDWVLAQAGLPPRAAGPPVARLADIGCGTGIATRLLAARGYDVVGVDPSEDMLAEARAQGGGAIYRLGEAGDTSLATSSCDLLTVAQALHWFDLDAALAEFARVLRPGGTCAAFWNERAPGAFDDDYEPLLWRFSREYRGRSHAEAVLGPLRAFPRVLDLREARFSARQTLDFAALSDRVHSSSYVAHGVDDRQGFEAELRRLFERHARDGRVTLAYESLALAWRLDAGDPAGRPASR